MLCCLICVLYFTYILILAGNSHKRFTNSLIYKSIFTFKFQTPTLNLSTMSVFNMDCFLFYFGKKILKFWKVVSFKGKYIVFHILHSIRYKKRVNSNNWDIHIIWIYMMKRCPSDLYRFIIANVKFQLTFLIRDTNYKDGKRLWKIHMHRLNSRPIRWLTKLEIH